MPVDRIVFKGFTYRLSGRYYRRNVWGSKGPSNLHRAIWEDANGPIPDGCDIHHIDGDSFNNELSNLECVNRSEHLRQHTLERIAEGRLKPPTEKALLKAAEWHKSPEGAEWHSRHAVNSWAGRKWHSKNCVFCGQEYFTPYPKRSRFCHVNCKQQQGRADRGFAVGVRPDRTKKRLLSGKRNVGQ